MPVHSIADDLDEPLSAELKIAYCWCVWRSSGEYRMKMPGSRRSTLIKRENAHQQEVTDARAAGIPSFCSSGDYRNNACRGANAHGGRNEQQPKAKRCIDSQLFRHVDSSRLSLV